MTEHTVSYKVPGGTRDVTREVFETPDGRILGTETQTTRVWRGWDGTQTSTATTDTRHFAHKDEAAEWLDDMFRQHEIAAVKANGGTKLVILS